MSRLKSMLEYIYVKKNEWIIADEERKKKSGFLRFVARMKRRKRAGLPHSIPEGGYDEDSDDSDEESEGEEDGEEYMRKKALEKYKQLYKVTETSTGTIVCSVLEQHGFTKIQKMIWNILWCGKHLKVYYLQKMNMFQRVNHFPKTSEITRKNYLYRNYDRMKKLFGDQFFNYLPLTFSLPYEYHEFVKYLEDHEGEETCIFIMKPSMLSRGRGVYVINGLKQLHYEYHSPDEEGNFEFSRRRTENDGPEVISIPPEKIREDRERKSRRMNRYYRRGQTIEEEEEEEDSEMVAINEKFIASTYIDNPFTIKGLKFDLRIYVVVTSYHPLRIYVYEDGLTRFASERYKKGNYSNNYVHLTNYSINKRNRNFVYNVSASQDDVGNKWSLKACQKYLTDNISKRRMEKTFDQIYEVINLTFISIEKLVMQQIRNFVPYRKNCFELFGFDILLDERLKPWLLEVNLSPSLGCRYPLDFKIKSGLLVDLFNMIEIAPYNREMKPVYNNKYCRYRPNMRDSQDMMQDMIEKGVAPFDVSEYPEVDFSDLSVVDSFVLKETIDEDRKKGGFIRIFPTDKNCDKYDTIFEEGPRPFNLLLQKKLFKRKVDPDRIMKIKKELYEKGEEERRIRSVAREERRRRIRERQGGQNQRQQQQQQQPSPSTNSPQPQQQGRSPQANNNNNQRGRNEGGSNLRRERYEQVNSNEVI